MAESTKRKAESQGGMSKKMKYSKFKATSRGADNTLASLKEIQFGCSGIWATCVRGLEGKATAQLREVLDEYATKMYPDAFPDAADNAAGDDKNGGDDDDDDDDDEVDIETAIKAEIKKSKGPQKQIFKTVRIDVACVLFFEVKPPMDAIKLVQSICRDAIDGKVAKKTRHINRLTPMTLIGPATAASIEQIGAKVLAPYFHGEDVKSKKFAIRTTIRNHTILSRGDVIKQVANIVGDNHKVDLGNPELVVLVDIYANTCGMSVVDGNYEKEFKRFNLNELYAVKTQDEKAVTNGGKDEEDEIKDEKSG